MPTQFSFEEATTPEGFSFAEASKSFDPTALGGSLSPLQAGQEIPQAPPEQTEQVSPPAMLAQQPTIAPPKPIEEAIRPQSAWDVIQTSDVYRKLFGEEKALGNDPGIVPLLASTPLPFGLEGKAGKALMAYFIGSYVKDRPQAMENILDKFHSGDTGSAMHDVLGEIIQAGMMGAGAHSVFGEHAPEVRPETVQPKESNASQIVSPTEANGNVLPQSIASEGPLPTTESGAGIQSQTEGGLPEQSQPDTAQEKVVLAPEQAPPADTAVQPEKQIPLGAATAEEFPADPGDPDIYGVAAKVRAERAKAGQTVEIGPGEGVSAIDAVIHGQEIMEKDPLAADKAIEAFNQTKAVSFDGMTSTRAKGELEFRNARRIEEEHGTDSPEYRDAFENAVKYDRASKEMQTEWSKTGSAQQGQTDIDTGTFTGLAREHEVNTGEKFTPGQTEKATKIAKSVSDARESVDSSKEELTKHIVQKAAGISDAERSALDAAHKTVRENAVRIAELENKDRLDEVQRKQDIADIEKRAMDAALQAASKTVRENAIRIAREENKSRLSEVQRKQDVSDIQKKAADRALAAADRTVRENAARIAKQEIADRNKRAALEKNFAESERRAAQKKLDEANTTIREAAIKTARDANKERVAKADLRTYVWTKAREYINDGMDNFDDIRHKLATDLGLPVKKVTEAMGKDKRAKFLNDDLWRKQQTARQLHEQAKRWLIGEQIPAYRKYLAAVPRVMFTAKVMGHGTVALGTHAPMLAFQPNYWKVYGQNYARMYKMVGSKAFYENQVQDLLRRPNYTVARRAGLVNDPYVYEDYNSPDVMSGMGKLTQMGNRGYSVLKMLRQDMFDQQWGKLPRTQQVSEVAQAIADGINHATGVTKVAAPKGASVALFAPRLEASRVAWLAVDPVKSAGTFLNWKNASEGDKVFALNQLKEKAWVAGTYFSLLALNQGFLSAMDSKQKINLDDPMKSDFLKFKAAGMVGSYGNAMLSMARLPARLFVGVANEGKLNKIVYEDENVASILFDFVRSQMSPFMGTITDLGIGRDFERRPLPRAGFGLLPGKENMPKRLKAEGKLPYTWTEYATQQALPIPAQEAVKEVWKYQGMTDVQVDQYLKSLAIFSVMLGTGGRLTKDYDLPNH